MGRKTANRRDFEQWLADYAGETRVELDDEGNYVCMITCIAWRGWNARIADHEAWLARVADQKAQAKVFDWQPIETVPHDERVVFFFPAMGGRREWVEWGYWERLTGLGRARATHWAYMNMPEDTIS